jgi:hypothetical protein
MSGEVMRRLGVLAVLLLTACAQQQEPAPAAAPASAAGTTKASADPERYARDREVCRATVAEYTKTRRNIDDSRREVFAGNYDRYGQTTLPTDMANYDDSRRSDRLIANCMEQRGYSQPSRPWWQKIGS